MDHKMPVSDRSRMLWTASKVDLAELIYSNYSLQSINGGKVILKEMQRKAESLFNIDP
ncbi:RteC domain-containing protein [Dysgonomonas sp. GY75]|uniref:RteC domain-containing protein n=1 Tax=Dysgonomonas sp. GY75 TaxID=2780419 RepID=UPI001F54E85F|nr:RteC domain-containing protein [Dysgonomonas sp. GY75]